MDLPLIFLSVRLPACRVRRLSIRSMSRLSPVAMRHGRLITLRSTTSAISESLCFYFRKAREFSKACLSLPNDGMVLLHIRLPDLEEERGS